MYQPHGFVVYRGPSLIDGADVVAFVTLDSTNTKTGPMAQAWILRADITPTAAIADGLDRSICGDCVHRSGGRTGRSCYVIPWLGPLNVWKAWQRGDYVVDDVEAIARALAGETLRLAAYGDPAAIPFAVIRALLVHVRGWTGYTHQWRSCDQRLRSLCMASVESAGEVDQAHALGWRTFRTRLADEALRADEIICPASEEAGHATTCEACRLCVGAARPTARGIAIIAHGQRTGWLADKKTAVEVLV